MAKVCDEVRIYHPKGHIYVLLSSDDNGYEVEVIGEEGIDGSLTGMTSWNFGDDINTAGSFMDALCTFIDQQQYPTVEELFMAGLKDSAPIEMAERVWLVDKFSGEKILAIAESGECPIDYKPGIQMTPEEINEHFVIHRIITCKESISLGEGESAEPIHYMSIEDILETTGIELYMPKSKASLDIDLDDPSEEKLLIKIFEATHALYRTVVAEIRTMAESEV